MQSWYSCTSSVINEFFLFFYQLLPTKCYAKTRSQERVVDVTCRLCKNNQESVKHLISNCGSLVKSLYKTRHDNAFKCFIWPMLEMFDLVSKCPKWYSRDEVKPHYSKNGINFYWDSPEYTGRDNESERPLRPDGKLVIDTSTKKMIFLIEITIPWIENRREKYEHKCEKYKHILDSIKFENPEFIVDQITLVIDVFGGYGSDLIENISKIINDKETVATIIKNMQKSIISSLVNLSRTFKIRCK